MSRKPKKETFAYKVMLELDKMEVGSLIDKKELVNRLWGINNYDWYVVRSCDVAICAAKKTMPGKKFKCKSGLIERVL